MKKIRLLTSMFIAVFLIMQCVSSSLASGNSFPDLDNHWSKVYVDSLIEKGGIHGLPDGTFMPEKDITLGELLKIIICVTLGEQPIGKSHWAENYFEAAISQGIILKEDYRVDELDRTVTRYDVSKIIHNTMLGVLEEEDIINVQDYTTHITDWGISCRKCMEHVEQCYAKGIIAGMPDGTFSGDKNMTRGEACAVIMRMLDKSIRLTQECEKNESNQEQMASDVVKITANEAKEILQKETEAYLVDVRTPAEYSIKHINGSILIPVDSIADTIKSIIPNESSIIIVFCSSGKRSSVAAKALLELGYINVYDMGSINDWQD